MLVRPIHYTSRLTAWRSLALALGGRLDVEADGWIELTFASGGLALHHAEAGSPEDGTTQLRLLVADLDAEQARLGGPLEALGVRLERRTMAHGEELRIHAVDGMVVTLDPVVGAVGDPAVGDPAPGASRAAGDPAAGDPAPGASRADRTLVDGPTVEVLWFTEDVAGAAAVLSTLGLRPNITSDSGGWADFAAPGGGVAAAHEGAPVRADLSFVYGDLAALQEQLRAAGFEAVRIDESYGVTLRVPNPDAPDDVDRQIWVSEPQRDLYGYTQQ